MGLLKKLIFVLIFLLPTFSFAFDYAQQSCDDGDPTTFCAATCEKPAVKTAVVACLADATCRTVYIPPGDCTWQTVNCDSNSTGCLNFGNPPAHDINLIGKEGATTTIIRITSGTYVFMVADGNVIGTNGKRVRISGIQFISPEYTNHQLLIASDTAWVQVDNCIIYGRWHNLIAGKRWGGGLIYNNIITYTDLSFSTSNYGIAPGQNQSYSDSSHACAGLAVDGYPIDGITKCSTLDDPNCQLWWYKFWTYPQCQGGKPFVENWNPAEESSGVMFVEGNTITWYGSIMQSNWQSGRAMVWRYNTIYMRDGQAGGWKPGAWYVLFYNNYIENINPVHGGCAIYPRSDSLIYNNYFKNYTEGGRIGAWYTYEGLYPWDGAPITWTAPPLRVMLDEMYIWGNTYTHSDGDPGCDAKSCWPNYGGTGECSTYDPPCIAENSEIFFKSPSDPTITGYPHRLTGFAWPTCPHPLTGLSGSCNSIKYGIAGYVQWPGIPSTPSNLRIE